jgi:hypothetical protein
MPSFHSIRHGGELHLGKRPASPLKPGAILYSELRRPFVKAGLLPKTPAVFGHGNDFSLGQWLMLGNGPDDTVFPGFQGCGDCAWAGPAHAEMEAARNAGRPIPLFSGKTVVEQYSEYSGYDPVTGGNDNGSDPQAVLQWRQQKGLRDDAGNVYKIGQSVALQPGNLAELWEAAYLFENVGIGVVVTEAQQTQFNERLPWDHVPGSPELGGHWVEVMGRPDAHHGALITWAERVLFTLAFYEQQNDEAFVYLDPERYSQVTGKTAERYSEQDLEEFLALVVQAKGLVAA